MQLAFAIAFLISLFPAPKQDPKLPEHQVVMIEGWTVQVDKRLLQGPDVPLGKQAMKLLGNQLSNIDFTLAPARVERLRKVQIFLDKDCGDMFSPAYHPSAAWLKQHGYSEKMTECVQIPKATYFVSRPFQTQQPWAMLHELAHAYHHQDLKYENKEILAAFEKFTVSKKYETTMHVDGNPRRHYALSNVMEFFAEMSESYVGSNDFYPFNRGELKTSEPDLFRLMEKIWGPI